ncbi:tRNA (adenosine(37)-N6)-threonylcarbamoyltransferase complex ATPase subunit type 1 TsaE [Flavobacteriaceae bacterium M23B6Z8]
MILEYRLSELDAVAKKIINRLKNQVVLFYGPMGTGKTTLIKSLVKELGITHETASPTFSLVNEYGEEGSKVYHFDLYRINSPEEALDIGFEEYLDEDAWFFIEWPQHIESLLTGNTTRIDIEVTSNETRKLSLTTL